MRAVIISSPPMLADRLSSQGAGRPGSIEIVAQRRDLLNLLENPVRRDFDLLIVEADVTNCAQQAFLREARELYDKAAFLLVAQQPNSETLVCAMRLGIREVIEDPVDTHQLTAAISRIATSKPAPEFQAKVFSFISCKGGSGATFIATNLAYGLASLAQQKVLLIDLHRDFGDVALYASNQTAKITLPDICSQIGKLNGSTLHASLTHVTQMFSVLAGAETHKRAAEVKPEHVGAILALARERYDYVFFDIGRQIDGVTLRALDATDVVFPVLQLTLPDIRDARRLVETLRALEYDDAKVQLTVNRHNPASKLTLNDAQRALDCKVEHVLPNDYTAASESVNRGMPLLQMESDAPVAKALESMARRMIGEKAPAKGFWARLLG